jgi:hypothetical protein
VPLEEEVQPLVIPSRELVHVAAHFGAYDDDDEHDGPAALVRHYEGYDVVIAPVGYLICDGLEELHLHVVGLVPRQVAVRAEGAGADHEHGDHQG